MHRIKIKEKGWDGYTGLLGTLIFENGISTTAPSQRERDYFGVVMRFVEVDEDGNELGVVSANDDLLRTAKIAIAPVERMKSVAEKKAEAIARGDVAPEVTAPDPMLAIEPVVETKVYTREELEAIGDKDGIKGLRAIGTPLGAKNTSIHKLIDEILDAQVKKAKGN